VAYAVVSIGLIELGGALFDALLFPDWTSRLLTVLLLLGFPVVVVLAWIFDIGRGGVRRTETADAPSNMGGPQVARIAASSRAMLAHTAPLPAVRAPRPRPEPKPAAPPTAERVRRASLAHVRHELKTPIGAILGYSEMLIEDAQGSRAGAVEDLGRIRRAGEELLSQVEQILDPAKAETEERKIEDFAAEIEAELRTPVTAVIGYAELLIETLQESGADEMVPDLERIRQAANRLLELSGDIIQLATAADLRAPTLSEASAIATGVLSKIRPLDADAGEEQEREGALLVVDDNALNRDLLSRQLARKGYVVATAENGMKALELLEERDFDLVLLDILMPEMDGIEVLGRIKAEPRWAHIPVIMISSLDEIDGAIRCMEIGAEDYLTKPFHPTLLDARIGACLDIRRMRQREEYYRAELERGVAVLDRVLHSVLPGSIAQRVRQGEEGILEAYAEATVLVCDLGRVAQGASLSPVDRAVRIEWLLGELEAGAGRHGLETAVLQGSAALIVGGIPTSVPDDAERVARAGLAMLEAVRNHSGGAPIAIRFGLHSGPVVCGVFGTERLFCCLWGDAVDLARRLELQAEPGTIHTSAAAHALLKNRFSFQRRGVVEVAGRGQMRTFALEGALAQAET
jgi:DNA-binding response OmpR family regulator/signal transduction histidine kinase